MLVPLALLTVAALLIHSRFLELLLFAAVALFGFAVGTIEVLEGRCVCRPDITREDFPLRFWWEVFSSVFLAAFGVWMLWLAL
jgi:hypothetical protein